MKRLLLSSAAAISILATGCASTSGAQGSGSGVALGDASGEPLRLDGASITGPHSSLSIAGDSLRGRYLTQPVALQWDYQTLTGTVGTLPARLELAEGDDTRIWGSFGGLAVDLTEDGTWLQGRMGACAYALKRNGDGLRGMRDCGGTLEKDIDVSFPQALASRPVGERAALMTLMLFNARSQDVAPRVGISSNAAIESGIRKRNRCGSN
jgi:hypothetical protein